MKRLNSLAEFEKLSLALRQEKSSRQGKWISLCSGVGCQAGGSEEVASAFEKELHRRNLGKKVCLKKTGCPGFCERGPLLTVEPEDVFYQKVTPEDVPEIIEETLEKGAVIERLLYQDTETGKRIVLERDIPFYKRQMRLILAANSQIDPTSLEDYLSINGYSALAKVLGSMQPTDVIEEVKSSGLRGRGGAGFLTGAKWEFCRKAPGSPKTIIANGDEGDPGAFMDRSVMEGNPYSVIEGMVIGAYAIGAEQGFMYVRAEYPLAIEHLTKAVEAAREAGFLGQNILGSGFDFDIEINTGAGAFVCGEETALIASLEGRRGMPRSRPPYPAISGFAGKPTNINNIETWANIPIIINKGGAWYSQIGAAKSKGTKIFSLVGKINNTGLVEVPMGIKLSEIIYEIGGGVPAGKKFKAVQTGGPSGGCLPSEMLNLSVDYENLAAAGSIMGSGGMIVLDEDNCMVDMAHYFLNFTQCESCGKCVPCRVGTRKMHEILGRIKEGQGKVSDIARLETLAQSVKATSLCGLGQTAPNPVLTTIKYFRYEYEAHVKEKRCPALSCKTLIYFFIEAEKCVGCDLCAKNCPSEAITGELKKPYRIDQEKCVKCGSCLEVCPEKVRAVVKTSPTVPGLDFGQF